PPPGHPLAGPGVRQAWRAVADHAPPAPVEDRSAIPCDIRDLPTAAALERLRGCGLSAVPVVTDLAGLLASGSISLDAHGAPAVPAPWRFA
ncbi:CoA transferase, partial [Streptomyces sp. NPDC056159]